METQNTKQNIFKNENSNQILILIIHCRCYSFASKTTVSIQNVSISDNMILRKLFNNAGEMPSNRKIIESSDNFTTVIMF